LTTTTDRVKPAEQDVIPPHDEAEATRSAEDHYNGIGRQRFVCYRCQRTSVYLADCEGVDCRRMRSAICPSCGEQNT
jgi:hypothetical protein